MLDFNSSLERYNSNGYRTPFIFILGSTLRTGEQNEMSKARRLFGNSLLVVIFTSGFHQMKGKIAGTIYISI